MTAPNAPVPVDADAQPPYGPDEEEHESSARRNVIEWVGIILAALVAAFLIKTFLLQAFFIPTPSMDPTLRVGDRVLVNKLSYKMHAIHRGDIVVFDRPPAEQGGDPSIKDLIKRVVALPGERVEGRDGHIWITAPCTPPPATGAATNCQAPHELSEPYLADGITTQTFPQQLVPPGFYWVMGDNRPQSKDSRVFGPISKHLIVGRAFIRVWPIQHLHLL
jgi:signal peptidase I